MNHLMATAGPRPPRPPRSQPTAATSAFEADTAVTAVDDDRYTAVLTDRWDRLGGGPLGGYTLAVALRALGARIGAASPVVLSAHFLRPASHGPCDVHVTPIRTGRRFSTGRAVLAQSGREVLHVTATYGDGDDAGRRAVFAEPPVLPPPEEAVDPFAGLVLDGVTIRDRVDHRTAVRPGWRDGRPSGIPAGELWMRLVGETVHTPAHLPLLVDAAAPMVLELGELGSTTLELTVHLRGTPAPGWLACRIVTRCVRGGFHDEDVELWDSTGQLVAQSRQLAVLA